MQLVRKPDAITITQQQLRAFWALEQAFMDARNAYLAEQAKLVLRLNSGGRQEPGKYRLEKRLITRRRISYKSIVVKLQGQGYVDNLLAHTKPTHSYKLEFAEIGPRNVGV